MMLFCVYGSICGERAGKRITRPHQRVMWSVFPKVNFNDGLEMLSHML